VKRTLIPSTVTNRDDDGLPGLLGPTIRGWAPGNTLTLVSGTVYAYRIYPRRDYSIALAWFITSTASGTDDPLEIAVFNDTLGTKVATTGSTTGKLNSTGEKTATLSVSLTARTPYIVTFLATSTATVRSTNLNSSAVSSAFGTTAATLLAWNKASQTIPLSTGLSSLTQTNVVPLICLRES